MEENIKYRRPFRSFRLTHNNNIFMFSVKTHKAENWKTIYVFFLCLCVCLFNLFVSTAFLFLPAIYIEIIVDICVFKGCGLQNSVRNIIPTWIEVISHSNGHWSFKLSTCWINCAYYHRLRWKNIEVIIGSEIRRHGQISAWSCLRKLNQKIIVFTAKHTENTAG